MSTAFGPFLLIDKIAEGGQGAVWLAQAVEVPGARGLCVVKILKDAAKSEPDALARFRDETRVAMLLEHPCVGRVVDAGRVGDQYYLALDVVAGVDVRTLIARARERGQRIDDAAALWAIACALDGLAYAHAARHPLTGAPLGIVHRDISPHNIMCDADGGVRVIDFGLALSSLKEAETEHGTVLGKLTYMSPEQARGERVDARCDLFAIGVVLYELLVGDRYWGDLTRNEVWTRVARGDWIPPSWPRLPSDVRALMPRLLAAQPSARVPDAATARDLVMELLRVRATPDSAQRKLAADVNDLARAEVDRVLRAHARVDPAARLSRDPGTESLAAIEVAAIEALLLQSSSAPPTVTSFVLEPSLDRTTAHQAAPAVSTSPVRRTQRWAPMAAVAVSASALAIIAIVVAVIVVIGARPEAPAERPTASVHAPGSPAARPVDVAAEIAEAPAPVPPPAEPAEPAVGLLELAATLDGCRAPCAALLQHGVRAKPVASMSGSAQRSLRVSLEACAHKCIAR